MKKITALILLLLIVVSTTLTSCDGLFGNTPGNTETPGGNGGNEQSSKTSFSQIVMSSMALNVADVYNAIVDATGQRLSTVTSSEAEAENEIVFGDTERAITAKAKAALAKELEYSTGNDTGYIIYFEAGDVAIYWMRDDMADIAVTSFINYCINELKLDFGKDGTVTSELYSAKAFEQEKYWIKLEAQADKDVYNSLKKLNNFYNGSNMCEWMAYLWDPDIGGFYYSNSARDNEGFLPDLESTNQVLNWLTGNGALVDINAQLPNDIKAKIVKFAKDMQSPEHGYFIHPQWGPLEQLNTDRYGRDLSWATSMIERLDVDTDGDGIAENQYPNYCAPSGDKCKEHTKDGGVCSYLAATASNSEVGVGSITACATKSVTSSVSTGISAAVSRVQKGTVVGVVSNRPDYSSSAAFSAWLAEYNKDIKLNSGRAHNLNALQDEIIAKGFCDELLDFVEQAQEEVYADQLSSGETPTGLWQYSIDYKLVWGVLKYMPFFNAPKSKGGRELKYAEHAIRACIEVIKLPPTGNYAMNDLMNQWSSMTSILSNVAKYDPDNVKNLREIVRENASDLIDRSLEKLRPFQLENQTYVYNFSGVGPSQIYGVPIAMGVREADVNGNGLCSSYYRGMFTVIGYEAVPLCTPSDGEKFIEIISGLEPVDKIPAPKMEGITFENMNDISKTELTVNTSDAEVVITEDPKDHTNNVLRFTSGIDASSKKTGDYLKFNKLSGGGNCIIFETKIYHESASPVNQGLFQVKIGNAYMLTIQESGKDLKLGFTTSTGAGAKSVTFATVKSVKEEWFKLRLEIYEPDEDYSKPCVKVFVNDELVKIDKTIDLGDYYYEITNGKAYNPTYNMVQFYSRYVVKTVTYFDDCYFAKENKVYDPDSEDVSDSRG